MTNEITTTQKQTLQEMRGEELYYNSNVVMVDYPFIVCDGVRSRLSAVEWASLYNEYWGSSYNEGYWLIQDAKEEFNL